MKRVILIIGLIISLVSIVCATQIIFNNELIYDGEIREILINTSGQEPPGSDIIAPIVTITDPTSNVTHAVTTPLLNMGGLASDNIGVTQVTWANNRGGTGICNGTTSWDASNITLLSGQNMITVTAWDAAGNAGVDTLTVTYTESPPIIGTIVKLNNPMPQMNTWYGYNPYYGSGQYYIGLNQTIYFEIDPIVYFNKTSPSIKIFVVNYNQNPPNSQAIKSKLAAFDKATGLQTGEYPLNETQTNKFLKYRTDRIYYVISKEQGIGRIPLSVWWEFRTGTYFDLDL